MSCKREELTADVIDGRIGYIDVPVISNSSTVRIENVQSPFMLHVDAPSPELACPKLKIERVVFCPDDCTFIEYKYPMPTGCTEHYLLPAGTYDISFCEQAVTALDGEAQVSVSLMVEPVTDTFAMLYKG